jgi:hypothetical protein
MIKLCSEKKVLLDVSTIVKWYNMHSFFIKFFKQKRAFIFFYIKGTACYVCSDLKFIGPYVVIYFYSKPTRCTSFSNLQGVS